MFGLSAPELLIILGILILIFGAKKLPELGAGIGRGLKNLKRAMKTAEEEKNETRREINGSPAKKEEEPSSRQE